MQEEPPISYQAIAQQRQAYFIYGLAILSLIGLGIFFFIDLKLNRLTEAYIIAGLMVFYASAIAMVRSGRLRLATILVAIVGSAGFFVRAYTDTVGDSGLFLFTIFPPFIYFLLGKKEGTVWSIGVFFLMVAGFSAHTMGYIHLTFSNDAFRDVGLTYVVTVIIIYLFQDLIETGVRLIEDRDRQLAQEAIIIERKVVERTQQLQEARARLLASINSLEMGYIMTDNRPAIALMNQSATNILTKIGVTKPTLEDLQQRLGNSFNITQKIQEVMNKRGVLNLKDLQFDRTFLQIFISPIQQDDTVIGAVVLIQDVTEAKVIERSKDEFFTIASHELRTPLTIIRGNVNNIGTLHKAALEDKELADKIDTIERSTTKLIHIVNDLLTVSRLEQHRATFAKTPVDIPAVFETTQKELSTLADEKKISLVIDQLPPDLPKPIADTERVKEVLMNLVGNAIKFTDQGAVTMRAVAQGRFVKIQIVDTGHGIAPANQNLLFHKFQQAGDSILSRDVSGGTGLGLYISKQLVEAMGGAIALEKSEVNKGSIFSFILPVG
jgi:signal transduction histidine kinase